jgi:hypothetical protein
MDAPIIYPNSHIKSDKPHPLCKCQICDTHRKKYISQSIVQCMSCKCKGKFTKSNNINICNLCHHTFIDHYCF